tara:strand:+ start:54 stop:671 length:618 start_codon:yes stop_codon:yes gene_type:complete
MYKFLLILSLFTQSVFSQVCDTILKNDVYNSYISYDLKMAIQVNYTLYKGGGDCDRKKFRFKKGTKIDISSNKQYTKSGYDRGHLANAKDFAYDCEKDEKTFRYYNCLPQTPNLNRGIWKVWETKIREESQTDSLLIMCGGIWEDSLVVNEMRIPTYCWKVVFSLTEMKIKHVLLFTNPKKNSSVREITICELEEKLNYKLSFKK